jgi:diguanylate cyclase (GGDEF)-like protein
MTIASYRLNALLVSTMQAQRDNERRAQQDALTGLSNRTGLSCAIERRWAAGLPGGSGKMALLYLDLDGFKLVNDTHGHVAGDQLLGMVADRLRRATPGDDCVARIGGDEFVLVCNQVDAAAAQGFGERLIREIAGTPYRLADGTSIQIGVSIGIALGPDHGADLTTLLTAADRALYAAKALGRGHCAIASAPGADPVEQLRDLLPAHVAAMPMPAIAGARTPPVAA